MKKTFAFAALLALGLALPVAGQSADLAVKATYEIQVTTSFGTAFTDCFRFSFPGAGTLLIDGFGTPLLYRFGDLSTDRFAWQAITTSANPPPFAIMFYGKFAPFGVLRGQGLNEFGDTFVLRGVRNDSCPAAIRTHPRDWRSH